MEIFAAKWRYYNGNIYSIVVNELIITFEEIAYKFNINILELQQLVKHYNGDLDIVTSKINTYIIFDNIKDAKNFAECLESLYMIKKLKG